MLKYRRTQGQPVTLYYRKSKDHRWRSVPKSDYAMRWEERANEMEVIAKKYKAAYLHLADKCAINVSKYFAVTEELEEVTNKLNLAESTLEVAVQDNLAKDLMIKHLEARLNKARL